MELVFGGILGITEGDSVTRHMVFRSRCPVFLVPTTPKESVPVDHLPSASSYYCRCLVCLENKVYNLLTYEDQLVFLFKEGFVIYDFQNLPLLLRFWVGS